MAFKSSLSTQWIGNFWRPWYVFHPITWVVVRFQTFNVNESHLTVDNLESYTMYNISIQAVIQGSQYPGNIISRETRTAQAGNGLISTWEKVNYSGTCITSPGKSY